MAVATQTNSWIRMVLPSSLYRQIDDACSARMNFHAFKKFSYNHAIKHKEPQSWCRFCQGLKTLSPIKIHSFGDTVDFSIPTGMKAALMKVLYSKNMFPEIQDKRRTPHIIPFPEFDIELRDYQNDILERVSNTERGMWESPTGSGKTLTMLSVMASKKCNSLIIVPNRQIFSQFIEKFEDVTGYTPGRIGAGIWEPAIVTIGILPMLDKHRGTQEYKDYIKTVDFVGIDEHHHGAAETWFRCVQDTEAFYRYGQSATLMRTDNKDIYLAACTGRLLAQIDHQDLEEAGWIAKPIIKAVHIHGCSQEETFFEAEKVNIFTMLQTQDKILEICDQHREDKVILLVTRVPFGQRLAKLLQGMKIDAEFIHSSQGKKIKNGAIDRFKTTLNVLITTQMLDEGFDAPNANILIMPCGGKSEIKQRQRIGRVLRPKDNVIVYDFMYHDHSFLERASVTRLSRYHGWGWSIEHV